MKRILFTLVDLNIGGVQKTLINLLNMIDYNKYSVDIIVLGDSNELIDTIPKNVNVIRIHDLLNIKLPSKNIVGRIKKNLLIKSLIKKYNNVIKNDYDYAIAFNGFNNYADIIAASVNAKKKIIWVHNDFYNMVNNTKNKLLYQVMYQQMGKKFAYFDNIVAVCDGVGETFNKFYNNKYKDKIRVINNIIDDDEIRKLSDKKSDIKLDGEYKIIAVGRLCNAKNYNLLIDLTKRLVNNNYLIKTYIVGDGENKNSLKRRINEESLEDRVILLGNQKNPYPIVKQADLLVSTSLYETFANNIIESLILGIPVVATNTLGASNIVSNIASKNTCYIGKDNNELYSLIIERINDKSKISNLKLKEYNKKVMNSFYDLLS